MRRAAADAIEHVRQHAHQRREATAERLAPFGLDADQIARQVRSTRRITVNFHPDRHDRWGRTVAAGLVRDGRYRSQFDTGISNGGRMAGGRRNSWEERLFGRAYSGRTYSSRPRHEADRPIYGGLDVTLDPHGAAPRFGSSFLVLAEHCFDRTTFTVGDSHLGPADVGTIDQFGPIVAGLFDDATTGNGLGRGLDHATLVAMLRGQAAAEAPARDLDGYVEAQVHGPVSIEHDVIAIVYDPSFVGSTVDAELHSLADATGIELTTHDGSAVQPEQIDPHFRGPDIVTLAHAVAGPDGLVDAARIGAALAELPYAPPPPDGDPETSPLQTYKKLWHCVLRFGSPAPNPTS